MARIKKTSDNPEMGGIKLLLRGAVDFEGGVVPFATKYKFSKQHIFQILKKGKRMISYDPRILEALLSRFSLPLVAASIAYDATSLRERGMPGRKRRKKKGVTSPNSSDKGGVAGEGL